MLRRGSLLGIPVAFLGGAITLTTPINVFAADEQQSPRDTIPKLSWSRIPTISEANSVVRHIFQQHTDVPMEERISGVKYVPMEDVGKGLSYGEFRAGGLYRHDDLSIEVGIPGGTMIRRRSFGRFGTVSQDAIQVVHITTHETAHAIKLFTPAYLQPFYDALGITSLHDAAKLKNVLSHSQVVTQGHRNNILKLIDMGSHFSEMYAVAVADSEMEKLTRNAVMSRPSVLSKIIGIHMHDVGEVKPPSFTREKHLNDGLVRYHHSYVVGEFIALALSKMFNYDLGITATYLTESSMEEVARDFAEICNVEFADTHFKNRTSTPDEFVVIGGEQVSFADHILKIAEDAINGVIEYHQMGIAGQASLFPTPRDLEFYQEQFPKAVAQVMGDIIRFNNGQYSKAGVTFTDTRRISDADILTDPVVQAYVKILMEDQHTDALFDAANTFWGDAEETSTRVATTCSAIDDFIGTHETYEHKHIFQQDQIWLQAQLMWMHEYKWRAGITTEEQKKLDDLRLQVVNRIESAYPSSSADHNVVDFNYASYALGVTMCDLRDLDRAQIMAKNYLRLAIASERERYEERQRRNISSEQKGTYEDVEAEIEKRMQPGNTIDASLLMSPTVFTFRVAQFYITAMQGNHEKALADINDFEAQVDATRELEFYEDSQIIQDGVARRLNMVKGRIEEMRGDGEAAKAHYEKLTDSSFELDGLEFYPSYWQLSPKASYVYQDSIIARENGNLLEMFGRTTLGEFAQLRIKYIDLEMVNESDI